MNRSLFLLICLLSTSLISVAQIDKRLPYCGESEIVKRDSTGTYWRCSQGNIIWCETHAGYKIFDTAYNLIEEGNLLRICSQLVIRTGKCTFYYPNGKVECSGVIDHTRYTGVWKYYYDNGQLKELITYGEGVGLTGLRVGKYESYYKNGSIRESGSYCKTFLPKSITDTVFIFDPATEKETIEIRHKDGYISKKCGSWKSFNEQGVLIKQEDYPLNEAIHEYKDRPDR